MLGIVEHLKGADSADGEVKDAGYTVEQLSNGGYSAKQFKDIRYRIELLKEGGYDEAFAGVAAVVHTAAVVEVLDNKDADNKI